MKRAIVLGTPAQSNEIAIKRSSESDTDRGFWLIRRQEKGNSCGETMRRSPTPAKSTMSTVNILFSPRVRGGGVAE